MSATPRPLAVAAFALVACTPTVDPIATPDTDVADTDTVAPVPNLVVVVLDDVGLDVVEPWRSLIGAGSTPVATPSLGALADQGLVFHHAWATPTCSPTRMGLHTGLYPSHAGVLAPITEEVPLAETDPTLPRLLGATYATGLFGKWHLGGGDDAPVVLGGWDAYAGNTGGALRDYTGWSRTEARAGGDVHTARSTTYATTAVVDDALAWLGELDGDAPWLVMLSFNAPHTPFHLPPSALRPNVSDAQLDANGDGACDDDGACYRAALQALDTELGRFFADNRVDGATRDTVVVALGDNGTSGDVVSAPFGRGHAKGTLFEGGVAVPLWISGPTVARGSSDALVHASVDVFATLLALGGVPVPAGVDGVSLLPLLTDPTASVRDTLYTDGDAGPTNGAVEGAALRDADYKVIWPDVTDAEVFNCFDLGASLAETVDLATGEAPPGACDALFATLLSERR